MRVPLFVGLIFAIQAGFSFPAHADPLSDCLNPDAEDPVTLCSAVIDDVSASDDALIKALLRRANSYLDQDDPESALADFEVVTQKSPLLAEAWRGKAKAAFDNGDSDVAMDAVNRAISLDDKDAVAHELRGDIEFDSENYADAIADYEKAGAINPGRADIWRSLADAHSELGEYLKSTDFYTVAINLEPDNADLYNNRGFDFLNAKEYEKARSDFEKALSISPDDPLFHRNLADVLADLKRGDEALTHYARAIELDPGDSSALTNRAYLYMTQKNWTAARSDLDKALEIDESDPISWSNRSEVRFETGDIDGALEDADQALGIDDNESDAWFNKAQALEAKGNLADALSAYRSAIEKDNLPEARIPLANEKITALEAKLKG
ncbi:MAG: tetratricopeptide repeat protein [Nitratireductor sp.]|nr:tetratricopeptide repeat protein [Nitratireductor sp.]